MEKSLMDITIGKEASDQRFDRFLRKRFKKYPQIRLADIYSLIRKGQIRVNGKRAKEELRVKEGDVVNIDETVKLGEEDLSLLIGQKEKKMKKIDLGKIKKWILYEDSNRVVFDKPAGIPMHGGNKHYNDLSMNDYLEGYTSEQATDTFKPAFGYRLDKDTSGVLIAAKTYEALQYINSIIRERNIEKKYLAIVKGKFPSRVLIDKPLLTSYNQKFDTSEVKVDMKNGLKAKTECRGEKSIQHPILGPISLVRCKIETGRMHQIRVHLADQGYPILGDVKYGNQEMNKKLYASLRVNRQLLHCREYSFENVGTKKLLHFQAPLPDDFEKLMESRCK